MRLGEQDNWIAQNNMESWIIPIQREGVYNLRQGSEAAIDIYERMLSIRPDDFGSVWLLNIAYMIWWFR